MTQLRFQAVLAAGTGHGENRTLRWLGDWHDTHDAARAEMAEAISAFTDAADCLSSAPCYAQINSIDLDHWPEGVTYQSMMAATLECRLRASSVAIQASGYTD